MFVPSEPGLHDVIECLSFTALVIITRLFAGTMMQLSVNADPFHKGYSCNAMTFDLIYECFFMSQVC